MVADGADVGSLGADYDVAAVAAFPHLHLALGKDLFDRRLSLFLNVVDLFGTVRTGGSSLNPYNPSVSESTTESRYISFGLTWRIGRTEMEAQQTHGKKESKKKRMANNQ